MKMSGSVLRIRPLLLLFLSGCPNGNNTTTAPAPGGGGNGTDEETITWNTSSTTVASGADLQLGLNNTRVGERDGEGALQVVFADGTSVQHGVLAANASTWVVRPLTKLNGDSEVHRATLGIVSDDLMLAAWVEVRGAQRSVAVARSLNGGQLWEPPLLIAQGDFDESLSLYVFTRTGGNPGAVLAWFDAGLSRIVSSAWRGTLWSATDWTPRFSLSTSILGGSRDVSVGGSGQTVVAAWEDNRFNPLNDIFVARSFDGGLNWSSDAELLVPAGSSAQGQNPSVALRTEERAYIAYHNQGNVYLATSRGGTTVFDEPELIGPGAMVRAAVNRNGVVALAWEHFVGSATNDDDTTLGLTVSLDDLATVTGPHALPGSASVTNVVQPSVTVSDSFIDVIWIDVGDADERVLQHRAGRLP